MLKVHWDLYYRFSADFPYSAPLHP